VLDALRSGEPYARWLLIFDTAEQSEAITDLIRQVLATCSSPPGTVVGSLCTT
jgi:hypothetical protein